MKAEAIMPQGVYVISLERVNAVYYPEFWFVCKCLGGCIRIKFIIIFHCFDLACCIYTITSYSMRLPDKLTTIGLSSGTAVRNFVVFWHSGQLET